jgi:rod shape-determining protein MreD
MIRSVIIGTLLSALFAALQSTLLAKIAIFHAVPDLALLVIIWTGYSRGVLSGEITGFIVGLFIDMLSESPLGMHAFAFTALGAASGLLYKNLTLNTVFLPALLALAATLAKALIFFLLSIFFGTTVHHYVLASPTLWVEMGFNVVLAPFLFTLMKLLARVSHKKPKGFSHA